MSDSRLLAKQQIWAATTDEAKNQAFNCSNRDPFTWKEMWRAFCSEFELEFDENWKDHGGGFDVAEMMNGGMGDVWDEIVEKHGLVKTNLGDVTCFDAFGPVTNLEFQHVCSMNKSREFGFSGYCNTLKSVRYWIKRMMEMKIIP